jgi:hypothetical protein
MMNRTRIGAKGSRKGGRKRAKQVKRYELGLSEAMSRGYLQVTRAAAHFKSRWTTVNGLDITKSP